MTFFSESSSTTPPNVQFADPFRKLRYRREVRLRGQTYGQRFFPLPQMKWYRLNIKSMQQIRPLRITLGKIEQQFSPEMTFSFFCFRFVRIF
jgi:hypothetical protein